MAFTGQAQTVRTSSVIRCFTTNVFRPFRASSSASRCSAVLIANLSPTSGRLLWSPEPLPITSSQSGVVSLLFQGEWRFVEELLSTGEIGVYHSTFHGRGESNRPRTGRLLISPVASSMVTLTCSPTNSM